MQYFNVSHKLYPKFLIYKFFVVDFCFYDFLYLNKAPI